MESINVVIGDNLPPENPSIEGPLNGKINVEQDYVVVTSDPENNNVYYFIDWGDDTNSDWIGPYNSNEEITVKHTWSEKGTFNIKVKAKDIHDSESDWTNLEVTMPTFKMSLESFLTRFITQYSLFFNIIRSIFRY